MNRARMFSLALLVFSLATNAATAGEPEWNPANLKLCDRTCLVKIMDGYMNAIFKHDPKIVPPLAIEVRMTENTGAMDVGEGTLWRSKVEPTRFNIYIADPISGQVALQTRLKIEGQHALVAVRLKVDREKIQEIEHLFVRNSGFEKTIDDAALPLLTTPLPILTTDVPSDQRTSRDILYRAANSYFDALEGDNGKIGAFAKECVRHENGYQTVNNPPPGGRMMPAPFIPKDPEMLKFSMMTCAQQIDTKTFAYMKHIRPRRVLVIDEQKGLVATFPLFVHDGTSRNAKPDAPSGMLQNLVTMETFAIRGGLIHHVEAFPFVTQPYGLGNGWTIGSGR
jgi:hypothetical protein